MAAPSKLLCYRGTTTSPSLSKTLSLLSSPFPIPTYFSRSLRTPSLSLHTSLHTLPRFVSRLPANKFKISSTADDQQQQEGDGEEEEELVDESDGGGGELLTADVDDLEEDARYLVEEFSSSLSTQLRIGVFFLANGKTQFIIWLHLQNPIRNSIELFRKLLNFSQNFCFK